MRKWRILRNWQRCANGRESHAIIHDVLAHTLTILSVQIQAARQLVHQDPERLATKLDDMAALLKESMAESRRVVGLLREPAYTPSEKDCVESTLRDLLERFGERRGVHSVFEEKVKASALSERQVETLQFALQEALTNAHRHGSARHVWVQLDWNLEAAPDIEVVGEAGDGIEATQLAEQELPDVMLMDIRMPLRDGIGLPVWDCVKAVHCHRVRATLPSNHL